MTYWEALNMQKEFNVAIEYKDIEPDLYIEVAKKYSPEQWKECAEALLEKVHKDGDTVVDLLKFVLLVRKMP